MYICLSDRPLKMFFSNDVFEHLSQMQNGVGESREVHRDCIEEQLVGTCPKSLNQFEFEGLVAGTKLLVTGTSRMGWSPRVCRDQMSKHRHGVFYIIMILRN